MFIFCINNLAHTTDVTDYRNMFIVSIITIKFLTFVFLEFEFIRGHCIIKPRLRVGWWVCPTRDLA